MKKGIWFYDINTFEFQNDCNTQTWYSKTPILSWYLGKGKTRGKSGLCLLVFTNKSLKRGKENDRSKTRFAVNRGVVSRGSQYYNNFEYNKLVTCRMKLIQDAQYTNLASDSVPKEAHWKDPESSCKHFNPYTIPSLKYIANFCV